MNKTNEIRNCQLVTLKTRPYTVISSFDTKTEKTTHTKVYYENYDKFEDLPYPARGDNKWEWEYWRMMKEQLKKEKGNWIKVSTR